MCKIEVVLAAAVGVVGDFEVWVVVLVFVSSQSRTEAPSKTVPYHPKSRQKTTHPAKKQRKHHPKITQNHPNPQITPKTTPKPSEIPLNHPKPPLDHPK